METASNFYFLFRWHLPGFVGHYTAFFLGLFFMLVYYIFFHPTGGAHIDFNRFLLTTSKRRRKVNKESTESGTPKDFAAKPAEAPAAADNVDGVTEMKLTEVFKVYEGKREKAPEADPTHVTVVLPSKSTEQKNKKKKDDTKRGKFVHRHPIFQKANSAPPDMVPPRSGRNLSVAKTRTLKNL